MLTPSFGATGATDAFLVAFLIPYTFYGVVGLALATVIVPLFAEYAAQGRREEAWRVMSLVVNAVLVGALMPSIVFMAMAGVFGGILNANNIFGPPAFGPAAMNLAIIFAALVGVWLLRLDELRYMVDLARDILRRRAGTAMPK